MDSHYNGSRSPVRAINTASRADWAGSLQPPMSWIEPTVHAAAPRPAIAPDNGATTHLACPECGTAVRLALLPAPGVEQVNAGLRTAPSPEPLPDFEDAVTGYKRELVARALEENDGVMTRAAKALGLKYTTFVAMVHRLDEGDSGDDSTEDRSAD